MEVLRNAFTEVLWIAESIGGVDDNWVAVFDFFVEAVDAPTGCVHDGSTSGAAVCGEWCWSDPVSFGFWLEVVNAEIETFVWIGFAFWHFVYEGFEAGAAGIAFIF